MVRKINITKVLPLYLNMRANILNIKNYQRICHKGLDADELTIRPGPANWAAIFLPGNPIIATTRLGHPRQPHSQLTHGSE